MDTIAFGGAPDEADTLLDLVLEGRKTATCWAARFGQLTHVGRRVALQDSVGRRRAVLETVSLERQRFCDVDEAWAWEEGEGDRSLDHWRRAHRAFFEREGYFAPEMELWCERFRVVEITPPSE